MRNPIPTAVIVVCYLIVGSNVAEAGVLQGQIRAAASISTPPALSVAVDAWACAESGHIADPRLVIAADRGLADVVVTVTNVAKAAPYAAAGQAEIVQDGCVFRPHVIVVAPGQDLHVRNADSILHTFRSVTELNRRVNKAQVGGKRDTVAFSAAEILTLECDVHYWMSAVVVVAPHALVAVSDAAGNFRIEGLEPGRYDLTLWHQQLGRKTATAVIEGDTGRFEFTWQ